MKLSANDIEKYLKVSRIMLYRERAKNTFPQPDVAGRTYFWEPESLREWCDANGINLDIALEQIEVDRLEQEVTYEFLKRRKEFLEKELERVKSSNSCELFEPIKKLMNDYIILEDIDHERRQKELDEPDGSIWPARSKQADRL